MKNKKPTCLYVSQYGDKFYARTIKELREAIPGKVTRMYVDGTDGNIYHIGYVIGREWLTKYAPVRVKQ